LRAGLVHVSPKDPTLAEKAMEQLNEDTVYLHSTVELKRFVMGNINAINSIVNQNNENARRLIAAAAAAARIEFNRVTNDLAIPPLLLPQQMLQQLSSLLLVLVQTI